MNVQSVLDRAARKVKYQYLINLLNQNADFPYAVIKGEVLSVMAYGAAGKRNSGDIDVLVDRKDLKALEMILKEDGFESADLTRQEKIVARAFSHQIEPYHKQLPLGTLEVDINYELIWGEWQGKKPSVKEMLDRREFVDVFGVQVPCLAVEDAFIQMCLHHYKDMNVLFHLTLHNPISRRLFDDVAGFWKLQSNKMDLVKLREWMEEYSLTPFFYYIAYYTDRVCNVPELAAWAKELESPEGMTLLDTFGLAEGERKKWPIPFEKRLENEDLPELVRSLLTDKELEKAEQNHKIFGGS